MEPVAESDWPCTLTMAEDEDIQRGAENAEDEPADAYGPASSSSGLNGGPGLQPPGAAEFAQAEALAQPAEAVAPANEEAPQPAAFDPMDGITYSAPADGGYVLRHGVVIGRLTTFGRDLSIRCWAHGCAHAVSNKLPIPDAVAWLAAGKPMPTNLSLQEKKVIQAQLKREHMTVPKPAVPKPVAPPPPAGAEEQSAQPASTRRRL